MLDALVAIWWAGPLGWMALYVSDYALTIACARLYRAQDKVVFEGSYEITPVFQPDVDALRRVSPRFLVILVVSTAYLLFVRALTGPGTGLVALYEFALGALILVQAAVHMRHLRNWYTFSRVVPVLKGRMENPRAVMLRSSAFDMLVFSALYAGLFAVTGEAFLMGGALGCGAVALQHYLLASRHATAPKTP